MRANRILHLGKVALSPVTPKIFIQTDSDYKEITPKTNSTIITDLGDNEYQADCEVVVSLPDSGISPRSSQTSEADQDAIIARLTITYSLSSDKEKIKISAVSGSWTGSITNLEMKDRVVGVTDGAGSVSYTHLSQAASNPNFRPLLPWAFAHNSREPKEGGKIRWPAVRQCGDLP